MKFIVHDRVFYYIIFLFYSISASCSVSIFFAVFSSQFIMISRQGWKVLYYWRKKRKPFTVALEKFNFQDIFVEQFGLISGLFIYALIKMFN